MGRGRGLRGRGAGGGMGWRNMFHATGLTGWQRAGAAPTREQQVEALTAQVGAYESALDEIRQRIAALNAAGKT